MPRHPHTREGRQQHEHTQMEGGEEPKRKKLKHSHTPRRPRAHAKIYNNLKKKIEQRNQIFTIIEGAGLAKKN